MHFTILPAEVQLSIFGLLPAEDLLSLLAVNKRFRVLSGPLAYASIELSCAWENKSPLQRLLRTLLRKPGWARSVRRLKLDGDGYVEHEARKKENPSLSSLSLSSSSLPISEAAQAIRNTSVPHTEAWIKAIESGSTDAQVALLISLLPGLSHLHLGPTFTLEVEWLGAMLRCALCEPANKYQLPSFLDLESVELSPRYDESEHLRVNNTQDVLPFFYLPRLEEFSVSIDNPATFEWPSWTPRPSIKRLKLSRLRETRLHSLLASLNGLEVLHWRWYYQGDLDMGISYESIDLDSIATALNLVSGSLRELRITAASGIAYSQGEYDPPYIHVLAWSTLAGIFNLGQLRTLQLPLVFLMGLEPEAFIPQRFADVIPPMVETLFLTGDLEDHAEFRWYDSDFFSAVELGLERYQARAGTQSLRKLTLEIPLFYHSYDSVEPGELERVSNRFGIQVLADSPCSKPWK